MFPHFSTSNSWPKTDAPSVIEYLLPLNSSYCKFGLLFESKKFTLEGTGILKYPTATDVKLTSKSISMLITATFPLSETFILTSFGV